ncbi:MAG: nitroreductase family protein [Candidatus Zixiibacteriota bacterium]
MELFEVIRKRRTIRTYTGKKIRKGDLERIVDAGRLAPSARNRQTWSFVVITEKAVLDQIVSRFHPPRKYDTFEDGKFDGTSAIIAVIVEGSSEYWREDGSAATQNMLLAGRDLGWGSCWIEGQMRPHEEGFKNLLQVPKGKRILSLIALGEPVKWSVSPPKKSLSEVLHWGKYREP